MAFTTLALILAGVATATSVVGQIKAGNAAKKAGEVQATASTRIGELQQESSESQAQLSEFNAATAELQAKDAVERGVEQESRFRTQVRGAIGAQRAGFAGMGVDVGFGSAVDVQGDAAFLGELDALTIRTNAAREAWGFKVQGEDLTRRAAIQRKEGRNQAEAGRLGAAGAIAAGNAQQTASRWGAASTILTGGSSLLQTKYGFGSRV